MAIRINKGTAPRLGRITMPQGTYLSNQAPFSQPTTAASGGLGEGGAMLPPTPQVPLGYEGGRGVALPLGTRPLPNYTTTGNPFLPGGAGSQQYQAAVNQPGIVQEFSNYMREFFTGTGRFGKNPDPLWQSVINPQRSPTNALTSPTNTLVGNDIGASPTGLSLQQVKNMFPGVSDTQIAQTMASMGYTYAYSGGRGGMWVKTGEAQAGISPGGFSPGAQNTPSSAPLDNRGRPQWVDPTQLARGERVTTQSGTTFVGGTPTASGQAQYAVTYPGGVDDERFKWAERTTQDNDGNWVKVYSRELRSVYTRSHRRKQQARAEEIRQEQAAVPQAVPQEPVAPPSVTVQPPVGFNQLVNLRADYG